ncbi:5'-AMP-activated serine/threonine-protein kinase catalytic subunit alpha-like [Penaeus vannamei]|uniref:5'-AMP-activated serine/threonine-protein kinase catalytic subunit alpha-like n=1 Tax=Penaeus vannamei TaxID=6689 RepID=UPI00387F4DC2
MNIEQRCVKTTMKNTENNVTKSTFIIHLFKAGTLETDTEASKRILESRTRLHFTREPEKETQEVAQEPDETHPLHVSPSPAIGAKDQHEHLTAALTLNSSINNDSNRSGGDSRSSGSTNNHSIGSNVNNNSGNNPSGGIISRDNDRVLNFFQVLRLLGACVTTTHGPALTLNSSINSDSNRSGGDSRGSGSTNNHSIGSNVNNNSGNNPSGGIISRDNESTNSAISSSKHSVCLNSNEMSPECLESHRVACNIPGFATLPRSLGFLSRVPRNGAFSAFSL